MKAKEKVKTTRCLKRWRLKERKTESRIRVSKMLNLWRRRKARWRWRL